MEIKTYSLLTMHTNLESHTMPKFSREKRTRNFNTATKMVIYTLHLFSFIKMNITGELIVQWSLLTSTVNSSGSPPEGL